MLYEYISTAIEKLEIRGVDDFSLSLTVPCSRYDSEYDNYRGGHMTSDAESEFPNEDIDSDVGAVLDELSLENIRQISKNITKKFGARSDKDEDSEE